MNFKRKTAYTQLKDPGLDCPNKDCDGWLLLYGVPGTPRCTPVYMHCSNRMHSDPNLRCNQPTIFSTKTSKCVTCDEDINLKDIITTSWDRKWIHFRCAHKTIQPPDIFAMCLRCNLPINTVQDSESACIGGVEGYIHIGCTKRKRQEDAGDDPQYPSSQDSLLSF
mgnify:FL=1